MKHFKTVNKLHHLYSYKQVVKMLGCHIVNSQQDKITQYITVFSISMKKATLLFTAPVLCTRLANVAQHISLYL